MTTRFFLLFVLSFSLVSCSRYQYFTVSSDLPQKKTGAYVFENDSIEVTYSFSAGLVNVEVMNKLNKLVYIDWSKSAMIYGSQSYKYADDVSRFSGSASSVEFIDEIERSTINGTIHSDPNRNYLPPNSRVSRVFNRVPIGYKKELKHNRNYEEVKIELGTGKKYSYAKSDSMNYHRSYLYLSDAKDSVAYPVSHEFWVSEVIESMEGEAPILAHQFQDSKLTGVGEFFAVLGLAIIIIVYVIPK